jgi:hypothetical protein
MDDVPQGEESVRGDYRHAALLGHSHNSRHHRQDAITRISFPQFAPSGRMIPTAHGIISGANSHRCALRVSTIVPHQRITYRYFGYKRIKAILSEILVLVDSAMIPGAEQVPDTVVTDAAKVQTADELAGLLRALRRRPNGRRRTLIERPVDCPRNRGRSTAAGSSPRTSRLTWPPGTACSASATTRSSGTPTRTRSATACGTSLPGSPGTPANAS